MIEVYLKDTKLEISNTADLTSGKKFKSRFIQPGLAGYPQQYGNVLITKESLDKFVKTLEGKPVIIDHQDVNKKNVAEVEVGRVHNVWFDDDGWYWCDGILTSQNAIDLIKKGYSVSCSYNVSDFIENGGTVNNIKYDMEFKDGVFTHLAIVKNPRYEGADIIVTNSKKIVDNVWITKKDKNGNDYKVEIEDKEYYTEGKFSNYLKEIFSKISKVEVLYDKQDMSYDITFDVEEGIKNVDLDKIVKDIEKKGLKRTFSGGNKMTFRYDYNKELDNMDDKKSDNSLKNTIAEAIAEVIAENIK